MSGAARKPTGSRRTEAGNETLGRNLRRLAQATRRLELEALAASGVTRVQAHALLAIDRMARPSMAMLARELGLAPSTVTRLVDPLVRSGLVERQPSPDDRRVVSVALSSAGRRTLRRVERDLEEVYRRVAAAVPSGEQARIRSAIGALLAAVEQARLLGA